MDSYDDKRQALIAQAIAAGSASAGRPWVQPWEQLSAHLGPLIGDSGFVALYRRTVRLVSGQFEWLASSTPSSTTDEVLVALREQLSSAEPGEAGQANAALLTTFTKLLSGLIGEALTVRLLNAAWSGVAGTANAREQS
jgi:hypothetical protein